MKTFEKNVPAATAETLLSETIAWLRFPLIVLVVFIHVSYGLPETQKITDFPVANMICENFVQAGIASVAVPLFFLISGFLYFYKTDWSAKAYAKKSRSRVKSLLVPFVVWSVPAIAYSVLTYRLGLTRSTLCAENHSLFDWLADVYGTTYGDDSKLAFPLVFQFWFLRDLFIVGLLSPLWHALLKLRIVGEIFLCALGVTWFCYCGVQFPGFSTTAVFFFCAGAYFAIRRRDFVADFSVAGVSAFVLYLPVLAADALTKDFSWNWIPHRAFICISVVAVVALVARGISAGKLREMKFFPKRRFSSMRCMEWRFSEVRIRKRWSIFIRLRRTRSLSLFSSFARHLKSPSVSACIGFCGGCSHGRCVFSPGDVEAHGRKKGQACACPFSFASERPRGVLSTRRR